MAFTALSQGSYGVTFTLDPSYAPERSGMVRLSRGAMETTADGQPVGHAFGTVSPTRHELRWTYMPQGTETATGGTDFLGLVKFFHLAGGAGASVTYVDVDNVSHTAYIVSEEIEKRRMNPAGSHYGPVVLVLLEYA